MGVKAAGVWCIVFFMLILTGCRNTEKSNRLKNPAALFIDSRVWGNEGDDSVTCLFQFKPSSSSAAGNLLEPPAQIELDGEQLQADSANLTGIYYELQKPIALFAGTHRLVFTDKSGAKHTTQFDFTPFTLNPELPAAIKREDLELSVEGLKEDDIIRVVLTDTAFNTPDINETDTLKNGVLRIKEQQLTNIAPGPLTLQLFKEKEQSLNNLSPRGGQMAISYGLTRDLELTEEP